MKIVRYLDSSGNPQWASRHADGSATRLEGDLFGELRDTGRRVTVGKMLAPLEPPVVLCVGLNYGQHAAESGAKIPQYPVLFMKMPSAVQHPGSPILLPRHLPSSEVDFECELAVVIGKLCKNVSRDAALDYVLGYTCANDVSARDWQIRWGGTQWCRGKTFDTFCPLGPWIVTPDEIPDPNDLRIRTILNGEVMQDWRTSDMIFGIPALIEFFSGSTSLAPGTVILTGTPPGVGFARKPPVYLQPGDTITVDIERIGELTNPVQSEM